nr:hypothetical protein [Tanacetum cinerariifolium]
MSTPRTSVTSHTELFILFIIPSDFEDEDTTLPVVSVPSSLVRLPASSGYLLDFDSDSKPTKEDPPQPVVPPLSSASPSASLFFRPSYKRCRSLTPPPPPPPPTVSLPTPAALATTALVLQVTEETIQEVIPLLVARLARHDVMTDEVLYQMDKLPPEHIESVKDDVETQRARLASTEEEC